MDEIHNSPEPSARGGLVVFIVVAPTVLLLPRPDEINTDLQAQFEYCCGAMM